MRQGRAAALDGELHQATVHHSVRLKPILKNAVVQIACLAVHPTVSIHLHQGAVHSDGHAAAGALELDNFLGEPEEVRLRTAGQEAHAKALADTRDRLHFAEKLDGMLVPIDGVQLEQGVVRCCDEGHALLTRDLLDALGQPEVPALATILEDRCDRVRGHRSEVHDLLENLLAAACVASDPEELRHSEGRHLETEVGHCSELLENLVRHAVLQEALDHQA
mmetsp:Transcript_26924/g.78082  ORF Transcript_26924/g.78082 Transcript_26924/m.78082 type:complete len:221 (+) Transcript_26924:1938-2600(+)